MWGFSSMDRDTGVGDEAKHMWGFSSMDRDTGVGDEVKHHVGLLIHGQRYRCSG